MRKSTCGHGRRPFGRRFAAPGLSLAALALAACSTAAAEPADLSPAGRTWSESFYENFAINLSSREANCIARDVDGLTRLVGPLVGQRPDDTPHSVWTAVDQCLTAATQGELARAIVYGASSAAEPALATVWRDADTSLDACVRAAGGWHELGSYQALMATCGPARTEEGES